MYLGSINQGYILAKSDALSSDAEELWGHKDRKIVETEIDFQPGGSIPH